MLVSACVWSERPLATAGHKAGIEVADIIELVAESAGIEIGGRRGASDLEAPDDHRSVMTVDDAVVAELEAIMDEPGSVLTGVSSRANRARVPAPFPVHRWAEHMPAVVVLPRTAQQVSEIVKLANRAKIPVVPRAGGTGLNDGAVPLRGGILVDVKRMNQIHEIDLADRTVTVGPGINMLKLNEELKQYGVFYPDTPASYPCSLGGRADRMQRLVAAGLPLRAHPRPGDVASRSCCRPARSSGSATAAGRRSASPRRATTSSTCSWAIRARSASSPRRRWSWCRGRRPSSPPSSPSTTTTTRIAPCTAIVTSGIATLAGTVLFDEKKIEYLRRDDEAFIPHAAVGELDRGNGAVRDEGGGARGVEAADGPRPEGRRALHRRRDGGGRLGVAPRPLRQPAARAPPGRHRRPDVAGTARTRR